MLITPAYAQSGPSGFGNLEMLVPLFLIIVAKITKIISFDDIQIEIAKGVNATIKRNSIQSVQVKTAANKSKLSKKKAPEAAPEEKKSLVGSLLGKK